VSGLRNAVDERLSRLQADDVLRRIWAGDHTVWRPDPAEIADRLGWLTVHEQIRERVDDLRAFARECAADGLRFALLAGMGGSSLAAEVFREVYGVAQGSLDLRVLDTTHPDQILDLEQEVDLDRTLVVVSSKSGTTIETRSHLEHLWERVGDGSRFVAITDPGTPLAGIAEERGFRRVFENPPDIGGRYSALSLFGLVPAALIGGDLEGLLRGASGMAKACAEDVVASENPAARLGALMGEAALAGRDKLTLVLEQELVPFTGWIEQLIAESTGKDGTGIVPVEGGVLGPPGVYGADRLFVALGRGGGGPLLSWLERAGNPVERFDGEGVGLGTEMFRWELAAAVAGAILGIHPFDQPDVESAKEATRRILESGGVPHADPGDLPGLLAEAEPPRYFAVQAYLPRTDEIVSRVRTVQLRVRDLKRTAATLGFGPRYLHSTGQLHKGGPPTGLFVQVLEPPDRDLPVPGADYTFGELLAAQAAGDLEALRGRGRPVARVTLSELEDAVGRI